MNIKTTIMNRQFYLQVNIQHQVNFDNVLSIMELDYSQVGVLRKTTGENHF